MITEEDVRRHLSVPAESEDITRAIAATERLQGCDPDKLAYNAAVIAAAIHEARPASAEGTPNRESEQIVHRAMMRSIRRSMSVETSSVTTEELDSGRQIG